MNKSILSIVIVSVLIISVFVVKYYSHQYQSEQTFQLMLDAKRNIDKELRDSI